MDENKNASLAEFKQACIESFQNAAKELGDQKRRELIDLGACVVDGSERGDEEVDVHSNDFASGCMCAAALLRYETDHNPLGMLMDKLGGDYISRKIVDFCASLGAVWSVYDEVQVRRKEMLAEMDAIKGVRPDGE